MKIALIGYGKMGKMIEEIAFSCCGFQHFTQNPISASILLFYNCQIMLYYMHIVIKEAILIWQLYTVQIKLSDKKFQMV